MLGDGLPLAPEGPLSGMGRGGFGAEDDALPGGAVVPSNSATVGADFGVEHWRAVLRGALDVYSFLRAHIRRADLGSGIVAALERVSAGATVAAEWSKAWAGWAELVWQVQGLSVLGDDAFMEEASACIVAKLHHFLRLASEHNAPMVFPTDAVRVRDLERRGWTIGIGEVWGRNDCLADSLLQLLVAHGVLSQDIMAPERRLERNAACEASRRRLESSLNAALRPSSVDGRSGVNQFLEHDRHAAATVEFFLEAFAAQIANGLPAGGIQLTVFSRFDSVALPEASVRICAQRTGARPGAALQFAMFNWTGAGCSGYHYDPLFPVPGTGGDVVDLEMGGDSSAEGPSASGASGSGTGVSTAKGGTGTVVGSAGGLGSVRGSGRGRGRGKRSHQAAFAEVGQDVQELVRRSRPGPVTRQRTLEFGRDVGEAPSSGSLVDAVVHGRSGAGAGRATSGGGAGAGNRERHARAGEERAESEVQRGIGDSARAKRMAARSQARAALDERERRGPRH